MKYFDADKLKDAIIGLKQENLLGGDWSDGYLEACDNIVKIIDSSQQEQPMPDSTQLIELWHEAKEMLKEKDFRDDPWRLAYNAFMCGFAKGVKVKKPSDWIREEVGEKDDDDALIAEKLKELHQSK